jgi:hypothetical protein
MEHPTDVARRTLDVPSPWTTICVVGAPTQHHRARRHIRLVAGGAAEVDLPVYLAPTATRIQIEIEAAWPAILSIEDAALRSDADSPFESVSAGRFVLYNAQRIPSQGGASALCVAGTMTWQIVEVDALTFGSGARLRMRVRRTPAVPLSANDPAMAEFARPERAVRAQIARLASRVGALVR